LKKHYAIQLALHVDALIRLGFSDNKKGIIYDIKGEKSFYMT